MKISFIIPTLLMLPVYSFKRVSTRNKILMISSAEQLEKSSISDLGGYSIVCTANGFGVESLKSLVELQKNYQAKFSRGLESSSGLWRIIKYKVFYVIYFISWI